MKNFLIMLFSVCCFLHTHAQEVVLQSSNNSSRLYIEHLDCINNHSLYVYGELSHSNEWCSYTQLFHEYKFLSKLFTHLEIRTMLYENSDVVNSYISGLSYSLLDTNNAYITASALYRYEQQHLWQATAVYSVFHKAICFYGYCDVYGSNFVNVYSENKLKIYINKAFIGVNVEISRFDNEWDTTSYIMAGFKF